MLVPLGQMREPAVILTPVRATDAYGGESITYTESACIFVALRSVSTAEGVQFGQMNADITYVLFGHWTDLNAVTSANRIKIVETLATFDINGGPINDPKRSFTRLNLVARENG